MSYSIEIDTSNNLVIAKFSSRVSADELLHYVIEMEEQGPFAEHFNLLVLVHPEAKFDMDTRLIREYARRVLVFSPGARRIIVATDDLAFGLSRIWGMESPNASDQYTTVKTIEQACEILGVSISTLSLGNDLPGV